MEGKTCCIECGGQATVSRLSLTARVEECHDCGRRSHWRVCGACGEYNGPRRVICMECGVPFEAQDSVVAARTLHRKRAAARTVAAHRQYP